MDKDTVCRQGIGFSPEIETQVLGHIQFDAVLVARGLASRLRLKHRKYRHSRNVDEVARGLASRLRLKP